MFLKNIKIKKIPDTILLLLLLSRPSADGLSGAKHEGKRVRADPSQKALALRGVFSSFLYYFFSISQKYTSDFFCKYVGQSPGEPAEGIYRRFNQR